MCVWLQVRLSNKAAKEELEDFNFAFKAASAVKTTASIKSSLVEGQPFEPLRPCTSFKRAGKTQFSL